MADKQDKHDHTISRRQSRRREKLDQKARELGFESWSRFETMVLHDLRVEVHRDNSTPGIVGRSVANER